MKRIKEKNITFYFTSLFRLGMTLFFSIVPYFCPKKIAKLLKFVEPFMEKLPFIKLFYCGTNLIYYEK